MSGRCLAAMSRWVSLLASISTARCHASHIHSCLAASPQNAAPPHPTRTHLYELCPGAGEAQLAALALHAADNACSDALLQQEGAAQGNNPLTNTQPGGEGGQRNSQGGRKGKGALKGGWCNRKPGVALALQAYHAQHSVGAPAPYQTCTKPYQAPKGYSLLG